jgi:hypothetical protein
MYAGRVGMILVITRARMEQKKQPSGDAAQQHCAYTVQNKVDGFHTSVRSRLTLEKQSSSGQEIFYGTRKFINELKIARHWTPS